MPYWWVGSSMAFWLVEYKDVTTAYIPIPQTAFAPSLPLAPLSRFDHSMKLSYPTRMTHTCITYDYSKLPRNSLK